MRHPELDLAIRLILDDVPKISEFDLIKKLKSPPFHFFSDYDTSNQHQLFQVHFLLFHALFQIQDDVPAGQFLTINSVQIELLKLDKASDGQNLAMEVDAKLKSYYLDLSNLTSTTESDVEALLDSFWHRYYTQNWNEGSADKIQLALMYFGFSDIEEVESKTLRRAFRKKCHDCHPDKGGNHQHFLELKRHYEMLKNRC